MTILHEFGDRPVIIKDYVKSRKHEWLGACFIPDASDTKARTADAATAIVVADDSETADTWIEDSSIAMTYMMLAAEEQNLGCCWVLLTECGLLFGTGKRSQEVTVRNYFRQKTAAERLMQAISEQKNSVSTMKSVSR